MKTEIDKELFKTCRNWFISHVKSGNDFYEFNGLEPKQFENILKRLVNGIKKKYSGIEETELNEKVFSALVSFVEFAEKNNYTVTALNLITKFNNITQHIKNEQTDHNNKGFNPAAFDWFNGNKSLNIYRETSGVSDTGTLQICSGEAGTDIK